jgi:hypothetical protein
MILGAGRRYVRYGSLPNIPSARWHVRFTSESGFRSRGPSRSLRADIVAKIFLRCRTKILRAADAFCARRCEGPCRLIQNRSRRHVAPPSPASSLNPTRGWTRSGTASRNNSPQARYRLLAHRDISLQSSGSVALGGKRTSNDGRDRLAQSLMTQRGHCFGLRQRSVSELKAERAWGRVTNRVCKGQALESVAFGKNSCSPLIL